MTQPVNAAVWGHEREVRAIGKAARGLDRNYVRASKPASFLTENGEYLKYFVGLDSNPAAVAPGPTLTEKPVADQ